MALTGPDRFGIQLQSRGRTLEQSYSMIAGVVYFVGGIIGFFITGFGSITEMTSHELFGIFMLNPFHNIVHLCIGGLWLLGAFALNTAGNEGLNIGIGGLYTLATVIGFMGYLNLLSIPSGLVGDNFLHLVTAAATLIFGSGLLRALGGTQAATA